MVFSQKVSRIYCANKVQEKYNETKYFAEICVYWILSMSVMLYYCLALVLISQLVSCFKATFGLTSSCVTTDLSSVI